MQLAVGQAKQGITWGGPKRRLHWFIVGRHEQDAAQTPPELFGFRVVGQRECVGSGY